MENLAVSEINNLAVPAMHIECVHCADCCECRQVIEELNVNRCFWCVREICWKCYEIGSGSCSKCANILNGTWRPHRSQFRPQGRGHRQKVMRPCEHCLVQFGARDMRTHRKRFQKGSCSVGTVSAGFQAASDDVLAAEGESAYQAWKAVEGLA